MKFVILSYMGEDEPRILFQDPGMIDDEVTEKVPLLMNINKEEGFYIEPFGNYCSGNLIFTIPNIDQNKKEKFQISIIITEGAIDKDFSLELLNGFKNEVLNIPDVYQGLYTATGGYPDAKEKFAALRNLVFNFGKSFPEQNVLKKKDTYNAKIFVFGLDNAGKTTIINSLKRGTVEHILPTIDVEVSKTLFQNICFIMYDAPGQDQFRELWKPYLNMELDGLVFVIDIIHRIRYPAAKELLFEIATSRTGNILTLPLLILFNKVDLVQPNTDILVQQLDLNKFTNRPIKWFLTSGLKNQNIIEGFSWLAEQIYNKKT